MTHPIRPVSEDAYLAARNAYFEHTVQFSAVLRGKVAAMVAAAYPTAVSLVAVGEYGEEFEMRLRAQRVLDAEGNVIAGYGPLKGWTEEWDDFVDAVDDVLDHLAQINGDEYLGEQTFAFAHPATLRPPVALRLDVADDAWEPSGEDHDPTARLNASLVINGVQHMHLEAHAIRWEGDPSAEQMVSDTPWPEDLDHLYAFVNPGTPFTTTTINGREYVLVAFPHSS